MSSYHSSFTYLNKNSQKDYNLIVTHFDPDNGETDSSLEQSQIYTDSYNGKKRTLYGTKYNSVQVTKITLITTNTAGFGLEEVRSALKWLTGNPEASWLDLYQGDKVEYRLFGIVKNVTTQKYDARTIGLNVFFESLSPWAFSPLQTYEYDIVDRLEFSINNLSDDLYTFLSPEITYTNTSGSKLYIENSTLNEITKIDNLVINEVITLSNNLMIKSDKPEKKFGNSFNFIWPKLNPGDNAFIAQGNGHLTIKYCYPIKIGDCATSIEANYDDIFDCNGNIVVKNLPWNRVCDTPTTFQGYGITNVYSKEEVDSKIISNLIDETELQLILQKNLT